MKKNRIITLLLTFCCIFGFVACGENDVEQNEDIEIAEKDSNTHYLRFMENNAEILRLVVLKDETYEDLLPYFPTLTQEKGYIKYWDGDYNYTSYTRENQFVVYKSDDKIIEIYSYMKKIN